MQQNENYSLIRKYNVPGPRYTSYPTVPFWQKKPPTEQEWSSQVLHTFQSTGNDRGISLYIHLPYCEHLWFYCGCNRKITQKHDVELPYINALVKEWKLYRKHLSEKPVIRELHLGGGTPTFFSAKNLRTLIKNIFYLADVAPDASMSFEAHPANTTDEHLEVLRELGFTRVSFGIQDFDPEVQEAINRKQSFEEVKRITQKAWELGYTSINYDLIYGLPRQTKKTVTDTFEQVRSLQPDRIAFYGYAHTPWVAKNQKLINENDLPKHTDKRELYELGCNLLEEYGYKSIGMDHFSLPHDELYKAYSEGTLHRNFMGYTTSKTKILIGLGASAISDSWGAYVQNEKGVRQYISAIQAGRFPILRGHLLSDEDKIIRAHITSLMCSFKTKFTHTQEEVKALNGFKYRLEEMEKDGLLAVLNTGIMVSEKGKAFVRNACMAFDKYLWQQQPQAQLFSSTV